MPKDFFNQLLVRIKNSIKDSDNVKATATELDSLNHILDELTHLPSEQAHYLAAFAFILYRVANADGHISDEEVKSIEGTLKQWGELDDVQACLVAEIAKTQHLTWNATDNYLVTAEFNQISTDHQKEVFMDCLFAVAASHDGISNIESDTIRTISREIGLEHADFIRFRQRFSDQLNALKD
jgi:uncharacterized tellurite resistance protein B-like protein